MDVRRGRVEVPAADLGVSKGGFYWQFKDRATLLEEMLDSWERSMVVDVIAEIESEQGDSRAKLQHLFELAVRAVDLLPVELALRDWARRDERIAARLRRIDNARMEYLRSLFAPICADEAEAEVRSFLAFSLLVGGGFIRADHPGASRRHVLQLALDHLVAESRG